MWTAFVELIRVTIFMAAHVCAGSLGAGIVCVSIALRLALLPLTLRLARTARDKQERVAALKPQLDALQKRHAADPARLMRETRAIYAQNDITFTSLEGIVGLLVQAPLLSGLFAAVRSGLGARVPFLWIGDLARPDGWLVGLVALLAGAVFAIPRQQPSPGAPNAPAMVLLGVVATLVFIWSASSAVALSVGTGSLVSGLQGMLLSRDRARALAAD
ncbi:hypothetical protein BH11GEM1_BH11GEM1_04600 [soil metagenome]